MRRAAWPVLQSRCKALSAPPQSTPKNTKTGRKSVGFLILTQAPKCTRSHRFPPQKHPKNGFVLRFAGKNSFLQVRSSHVLILSALLHLSAVGMMASSALVAFGLARIKFKGRNIWFVLMVVTMMLPGQVMMIPRFVLFNSMGWVGTYLPMIVPSFFASGFNIFLIMQFIRGIPRDMDEAAKIDGCSWYGVFFRIIVPMIVPSLVTVAVLTFMSSWEDFMGALLYLNKPETYTVAYALKMFNDSSMSDYGATFAMSAASLVPILVLFFFFQKNLVEGISIQGLKG